MSPSENVGARLYVVLKSAVAQFATVEARSQESERGALVGDATVEILTTEAAQGRRQEILASVGGDENSLRARANIYALNAKELAVLDELDALDYLLGDS